MVDRRRRPRIVSGVHQRAHLVDQPAAIICVEAPIDRGVELAARHEKPDSQALEGGRGEAVTALIAADRLSRSTRKTSSARTIRLRSLADESWRRLRGRLRPPMHRRYPSALRPAPRVRRAARARRRTGEDSAAQDAQDRGRCRRPPEDACGPRRDLLNRRMGHLRELRHVERIVRIARTSTR